MTTTTKTTKLFWSHPLGNDGKNFTAFIRTQKQKTTGETTTTMIAPFLLLFFYPQLRLPTKKQNRPIADPVAQIVPTTQTRAKKAATATTAIAIAFVFVPRSISPPSIDVP